MIFPERRASLSPSEIAKGLFGGAIFYGVAETIKPVAVVIGGQLKDSRPQTDEITKFQKYCSPRELFGG